MSTSVYDKNDTAKLLLTAYLKILKINLSDESFSEVKVNNVEVDHSQGYSTKISEWFKGFAYKGNVFTDDLKKYLNFTDLDYLKKQFADGKDALTIRYRRRYNNNFRWVKMTIQKSQNYSKDNEIVILYVEDINDDVLMSEEINQQHQITERLVDMYFTCLFINMNNNKYIRMHVSDEFLSYVPEKGDMNEIMGAYIDNLAIPYDMNEFNSKFSVEIIREELQNLESYDYEYLAKTSKGDIWVRISAILVDKNEDGTPNHILIALKDVTSQVESIAHTNALLKDAFSSALAASTAKSEFLSRVSHDIRTPLNGIIGMTAIAGAHIDEQAKVTDCLSKISSASKHLLSLINDILDLSKIESGKINLTDAEFSLPGLIEELINIVHTSIEEKHHELNVYIQNIEHENVIGDNVRLQQVFMNLLSNAIKYTQDYGNISIYLQELSSNSATVGQYRFICEDNGYGMTKEFQEKVFEPFERSDDARINKTQGTGLGMAIAQNIVNLMGGDIKVESEPDVGTKFTVDFKIKINDNTQTDADDLIDLPILVVDDDEIICESTCITLNELGMKSEYTLSGEDAVEKVIKAHENNNDYFACLIDWKMDNGIDGFETTRRIRKAVGPEVTIIIISAYEWDNIEEEARKAGADAFIAKPLFKSRLKVAFKEFPKELNIQPKEDELNQYNSKDYSSKRVLLVEDNALNREVATEIINMTNAKVETAENGKIAVEMFEKSDINYYDMIFMDVRMPIMDGYEATRTIRSLKREDAKEIPIVALSANAFIDDINLSKEAGMNMHMAKPIDFDKLLNVMETCFEKKYE